MVVLATLYLFYTLLPDLSTPNYRPKHCRWHHINTRRISLQMCLFWNRGLGEKAVATYGFGIKISQLF